MLLMGLALRCLPASQHRKNPIYLSISQVLGKRAQKCFGEPGSRRCAQSQRV